MLMKRLARGGEMGELIRGYNWDATPMGRISTWPQSLVTAVSTCLASQIAMCVWWGSGHINLYNDAFRVLLLGNRHPWALGQRGPDCCFDIWHVVGPMVESSRTSGEVCGLEDVQLQCARGGVVEDVYVTFTCSPVRDGYDDIAAVQLTCQENGTRLLKARRMRTMVRDLRVAQERLAFTLTAAAVGFWEIDVATGAVVHAAHNAGLWGGGAAATVETLLARLEPPHRAELAAAIETTATTGSTAIVEFPIIRRDGEERCLVVHLRRELDGDTVAGRIFGLVTDITEHRRVEVQRQSLFGRAKAAHAAAETANRAKDDFLAVLGHELRNPLAPIVSALQLLPQAPATLDRVLPMIERNVKHMVRLVDDLLDVARINHGTIKLDREVIELALVVARGVEMSRPLLDQHRHRLSIDVPSSGLAVDVDPTRLAQVISNLVNNAATYTPPGGHVAVTAARTGEVVTVSVRDTGPGISPEMKARIFDMFVQGAQPVHRLHGGLGVGLNIVRHLVQLHDGQVECRSDGLGHGAEFRVSLPAKSPSPVVAVAEPLRILVVDDNEDAATVLAELLALEGYAIQLAYDGREALRRADEHLPHVALLDIGMPGMDGYELGRLLRLRPALEGIRLVALTGYGQDKNRDRSAAAGFDAHVVKPVDMHRLRAVIQSLVASS